MNCIHSSSFTFHFYDYNYTFRGGGEMNTYQAPTVCQEILYFYFSFYSHFNPRREVLLCPSTLQMKELRLREVMWQAQAPAAMSWRAGILMKADQQWSQCPPKLLSIATPGRPFPPIKECRISSPSTISSATSPPCSTLIPTTKLYYD